MASYQAEVLADSPVLYLRLSETSGAVCADSSTSAFTGTAHGTFTRNVATGQAGWGVGITLGGAATDNVTVPNAGVLEILLQMTYECVIKPTSLPANAVLMSKGYVSSGANSGYSLFVQSTGVVILTDGFNGTTLATSAAGAVTAGTAYHVAVTRDGAGHGIVYVNGVAGGTTTVAAGVANSTRPFTIGGQDANGTILFPYPGLIDEVAVYNTNLSAARIAAHYAARGTAASTGGGTTKSPPGALVASMAHDRNAERKADHQPETPAARRVRLDYLHKRGH